MDKKDIIISIITANIMSNVAIIVFVSLLLSFSYLIYKYFNNVLNRKKMRKLLSKHQKFKILSFKADGTPYLIEKEGKIMLFEDLEKNNGIFNYINIVTKRSNNETVWIL